MQSLSCSWTIIALLLTATPLAAQCTGDCNHDGKVTIDELLLGTGIALDPAQFESCPEFDSNSDDKVEINELVEGVKNIFDMCPATPTPTSTSGGTPSTATPTPSPTATPTTPPGCGDGNTDFAAGETCDDGNTSDLLCSSTDPTNCCPANCRIATCRSAGTRRTVDVSFTPPSGFDINGITVFLRYPEDHIFIEGQANDENVFASITNTPNAFLTPNDLDYGLRLVMFSQDQPFTPGLLFSVTFDDCMGAAAPTNGDFYCVVEDASSTQAAKVEGVTCMATLE